jgi:hydroxyacylglutathione hydrolase
VVLSGHGSQTTIGQERAANPYLRQVAAAGQGPSTEAPRRGM